MALGFTQKKQFGPSGVADVRVNAKSVRIVFDETGDVYEIETANWDKKRPTGKYRVTLSKAGDKIIGINPVPGSYLVSFKEFGNRIDGIPTPKIQRGGVRARKDGQKWIAPDKMVFNANLQVESDDCYDGLTILSIQAYGFEPLSGTPFATVNVENKRDLERIELFMRLAGYDFNVDIPYQPNVLPWLEESLKRACKTFMVTTNADGFIDSMAEVPTSLLKRAPAKKKTKK
jgi:hypothetical protein